MPVLVFHSALGPWRAAPLAWQVVAGAAALLSLVGAATVGRRATLGRTCGTLALLATLALGWPVLWRSPQAMLASLTGATLALALLWRIGAPLLTLSAVQLRPTVEGQAQGAGIVALVAWVLWELSDAEPATLSIGALGWSLGCSWALGLEWALRQWRTRPRATHVVAAAALASAAGALAHWDSPRRLLGWLALSAAVAAFGIGRAARPGQPRGWIWEPLVESPERIFVGTFAGLCILGTLLLALPQSSASGLPLSLVDAAFTATSAVCVTGLVVVDTGRDFSGFGQGVLLLLIQVGGLGIMTFSTAALWALGRRLSLRHEGVMASLISTDDRSRLFDTARRILVLTVSAELAGAILLTVAFVLHGDPFGMALWRGVFTAVSAFCNAGFALQTDSLVPYQQSALVLHTVATLIVLGGISPLAVLALPNLVRRTGRPVPAQVKLGLSTSAALLVTGFLLLLSIEWSHSLLHLGVVDKLHNAWFQSVTLRTAGFNSIDFNELRASSITWMLAWMFIGGSPGGTAGGVKTTTVALLGLAVVQAMRGQPFLEIFGRRVPQQSRTKAEVVLVVASASGLLALLALQLTQKMPTQVAVFEVVSALGTVGLTLGGTAELDGIGKGIVLACMFTGRVGALTLLMFLASRRASPTLDRPEEDIDVG